MSGHTVLLADDDLDHTLARGHVGHATRRSLAALDAIDEDVGLCDGTTVGSRDIDLQRTAARHEHVGAQANDSEQRRATKNDAELG